jgi:hypothetical protein
MSVNLKDIKVGNKIHFLCNGNGRGGHVMVSAIVTKLNRKTVDATEAPRSYRPGTLWNVHVNKINRVEVLEC